MTTDLIAQAEAVLDGVTPEPWWHDNNEGYSINKVHAKHPTDPRAYNILAEIIGDSAEAEANAAFIAWCRAGVPALIARIRELEGERDEWKTAWEQSCENWQKQCEHEMDKTKAAEAKLAEVEWQRDQYRDICEQREEIIQARTARYQAAEATVATLTAQVEAMRDQLAARGDELTKAWHRIEQADELAASVAAPRYGMHGMPAHVSEALKKYKRTAVTRAALTTENQTNG